MMRGMRFWHGNYPVSGSESAAIQRMQDVPESRLAHDRLEPVLHQERGDPLNGLKVFRVAGDQNHVVGDGDGGYLRVLEVYGSSQIRQPRPYVRLNPRGMPVIGNYGISGLNIVDELRENEILLFSA